MNCYPFLPLRISRRALWLMVSIGLGVGSPGFAAKVPKTERREMKRDSNEPVPEKNVADAASRAASKLREQMDVPDDSEWELISGRIATITELRRLVSSGGGARGVAAVEKVKGAARPDRTAQLEQEALRMAVRDKLPDAELKLRLARAHDIHRQNEAKLAKAQEELRAVLTVRQEAVAVVAGVLPP